MNHGSICLRWPDGAPELTLPAAPPTAGNLAQRLSHASRPLNTRCGQRGLCGGCTIQLVSGTFHLHDGAVVGAPAEIKACRGHVPPGVSAVVAVPARSLAVHRPQVVTSFTVKIPTAQDPILALIPGVQDHGFAIDLGTTTVVVALVDLRSGTIIAEQSAFNRQIELGDDVITRIQLAGAPEKREELRHAILARTLAPLAQETCTHAKVDPARLAGAVIAGNTTMLHLLTGTDPTPMGVAPFRAPFTGHRILMAGELGFGGIPPSRPVHLLPGFSAYVGADLVAGCVCTGLLNDAGPNLLIDIGTNGEILLQHGGRLLATATAAGPAFEGGRLTSGTRAVPGAVEHLAFPGNVFPPELTVIAGARQPIGLCGSAYVDFLARARGLNLLSAYGRFTVAAWSALPAAHRHDHDGTRGVYLSPHTAATLVTEADIAHLLQAKAAIAAGILVLLRRAHLEAKDIKRLYLAGGFGLHLDVPLAIACGLLPGFTPGQIEIVGNTALGGAWLALNDHSVLDDMIAASTSAEIVELNLEPDFEDTFIEQLALP